MPTTPPSSTSNSDRAWRRQLILGGIVWAVGCIAVLLLIVIVDPYGIIPIAPHLDRRSVSSNRNFSVAGLARKRDYDSAIVGSSTVNEYRPADLDAAIGGRFVNLSIWGGNAWQQSLAVEAFSRNHPDARTMLVGLDNYWCVPGGAPNPPAAQFRPRMYDSSFLRALPGLFGTVALSAAWEELDYLSGRAQSRVGPDGYESYLPPLDRFVPSEVRNRIYGDPAGKPVPELDPEQIRQLLANWKQPYLASLDDIIRDLPPSTRLVLYFSPYHNYRQHADGASTAAMFEACKRATVDYARRRPNALVLDFMIPSELTRNDANYWDGVHISGPTAKRVADVIGAAMRGEPTDPDLVHILYDGTKQAP
jgi:hypothetical protein